MSISHPFFNPACPQGGNWYACGNGTKFVGCCTANPCTSSGCFQGNLRPASFNISQYGKFSDQLCNGGLWYTCNSTTPSFMGCCASDPCRQGACATSDLRAGYLSNNIAEANQYDPQPPLPGSQTSISSPSATASSTPGMSSVGAAPAATIPTAPRPHSLPTGAIAGAAVGGVIILVVTAVFFIWRRRRNSQQCNHSTAYSQVPNKGWPSPPRSGYSPYLDDMRKGPPRYSANSIMPQELATPPTHSPRPLLHEAASHEIMFVPYSPHHSSQYSPRPGSLYSSQPSPSWNTDHTSERHSTAGLGVRRVTGNSEYMRAELGGHERGLTPTGDS